MQRFVLRGCLVATLVAMLAMQSVEAGKGKGNANPGVLPPNSNPHGLSYAEWGDAWWNWAVEAPSASSPLLDTTGDFAHIGQKGSVFFLAGTLGGSVERTVTIPPGKSLFFPIITSTWWVPEDAADEAGVRAIANATGDAISVVECSVDGKPLTNLSAYRVESAAGGYVLSIPEGSLLNEFGYPAGDRDPAVADGYYVMLAPLSKGQHTIHAYGAVGDPDAPDFFVEFTYTITVGH